MLLPVIQGTQRTARRTAQKPSLHTAVRKHLLHNLIGFLPGLLGKFHLLPVPGHLLHLHGSVDKQKRYPVLCTDFAQQQSDPQILSAGRIQSFQICIDIIFDIKLNHLIPFPDLPDILWQFRIRIVKFTHNFTPLHDVCNRLFRQFPACPRPFAAS